MRYLSVFETDKEVLKALSDIHLRGKWQFFYSSEILMLPGEY